MRHLVLVVLGVIACLSSNASGQFGMLGNGENVSLTKMATYFDGYADMLKMSEEQRVAARELVATHVAEGNLVVTAMNSKMQALQEEMQAEIMASGDPMAAMQTMQEKMVTTIEESFKSAERIENAMMSDIQLLLDDEQVEQWPSIERRHRRLTSLGANMGTTNGEAVDLIDVLEKLEIGEDAVTAAERQQYAIDLDRALKERNDVVKDQIRDMMEFGMAMGMGMGAAPSDKDNPFVQMRKSGLKLRDINRRYARRFEGMLSTDVKAKFDEAFKLRAYPLVYTPSPADRRFRQASTLTDLSEDQRQRLDGIVASYDRDLSAKNDEFAAALSEFDEDLNNANPMAMNSLFMGMGGDDRISKARRDKEELEQAINRRIEDVLTKEQLAQLPAFSQPTPMDQLMEMQQELMAEQLDQE